MKRQLVVFEVGSGEFAVDIMATKEVVGLREIAPVPETPDYVEGVMNLRGNLVPVLDLRKRMRARGRSERQDARIIVASLDGRFVGLIVDRASDVIRVDDEKIEPAPDIIADAGATYVTGVINLGNRFVTLIDLKKALSDEVLCEIDEVLALLSKTSSGPVAPAQAV